MSKILKRPMFRKGGEVGGGIMSGITSRSNYENGTPLDEILASPQFKGTSLARDVGLGTKLYQAALGEAAMSKGDILANLLIKGGLRGLSTTGGTTLQNLARSFEEPTAEALQQRQALKTLKGQAALKGIEYCLTKQQAEMLQRIKSDKGFESGTEASRVQSRTAALKSQAGYGTAEEEADIIKVRQEENLQTQGLFQNYIGTGPVTETGQLNVQAITEDSEMYPVGAIIYDPRIKKMRIVDENRNLILLSQARKKGD